MRKYAFIILLCLGISTSMFGQEEMTNAQPQGLTVYGFVGSGAGLGLSYDITDKLEVAYSYGRLGKYPVYARDPQVPPVSRFLQQTYSADEYIQHRHFLDVRYKVLNSLFAGAYYGHVYRDDTYWFSGYTVGLDQQYKEEIYDIFEYSIVNRIQQQYLGWMIGYEYVGKKGLSLGALWGSATKINQWRSDQGEELWLTYPTEYPEIEKLTRKHVMRFEFSIGYKPNFKNFKFGKKEE